MKLKPCLLITLSSLSLTCFATGCGETNNYYYTEDQSGDDSGNQKEQEVIDNTENTQARCSDGIDNDKSGKADCDDPNCAGFSFCAKTEEGKENTLAACADGDDNDGDGKIDCNDPECKQFMICQEKVAENTSVTCKDGLDNDGDGNLDCDDSECKDFAFCQKQPESKPEPAKEDTEAACTDGLDNDGDGNLDCLDSDCQKFEICQALISVAENTMELCTDGIDNDFNGVADDKDPNCEVLIKDGGKSGEASYEQCKDKLDNDGDGKMDCDDPECLVYDVCMNDFDAGNDVCPDDPFKFKDDGCDCGQTKLDGKCYINITRDDNFFDKIKDLSKDDYLIKQPIDLGETTHSPIYNFTGTLNGGNHRITGVLNQNNAELEGENEVGCGIFDSITSQKVVFKDIDIAITLNCRASSTRPLYIGALASLLDKTSAEHITGSSKVYVQIASTAANSTSDNVRRYIGGLFGYAKDVSDVKLTGNVSVNIAQNLTTSSGAKAYNVIGGVVGYASTMKNIEADANVTLSIDKLETTTFNEYEYIGGLAGGVAELENASNRGHIKVIAQKSNGVQDLKMGGLVGEISTKASNVSFTGIIENSNSNVVANSMIYANSGKLSYGNMIGGITGSMEVNDALEIDRANVDADIITLPDNALIGGIVGVMTKAKTFVRNSTSHVNLTLLPTTGSKYSDGTYKWASYYGGIAGGAAGHKTGEYTAYITNNSAHTNFINIHNLTNLAQIGYGGIIGYNSGILVNNFASDRYICAPDVACPKIVNGIGGLYAYESYYNQEFASTSGSTYSDASTEAYQFNATGTPVTRTQKSVLGLLRYNAGYDGGVLSANIPANIDGKYSNWTTTTDDEGHVIPVPDNQ